MGGEEAWEARHGRLGMASGQSLKIAIKGVPMRVPKYIPLQNRTQLEAILSGKQIETQTESARTGPELKTLSRRLKASLGSI